MRADGLLEWLRSCPERDWFVEVDSGSTVELDAAQREAAYLFRSPANARRLLIPPTRPGAAGIVVE